MKIIRQFVGFVLGITVGVCLYSFLKLRPLTAPRIASGSSETGANHLGKSLCLPWVQRPLPPKVIAPLQVRLATHLHALSRQTAEARSPVSTKPATAEVGGRAAPQEVAAAAVASRPSGPSTAQLPLVSSSPPLSRALPAPTIFKTIGYVEKAGGQLEAIILQENQIQVVHIGEYIEGRYLVTKITPDLVDAVDETLVQSPMAAKVGVAKSEVLATNVAEPVPSAPSPAPAQPEVADIAAEGARQTKIQAAEPVANSLGYVQQADGEVETVVADGESVRLIPESPVSSSLADVATPGSLLKAVLPTQSTTASVAPVSLTIGAIADNSISSGTPSVRSAVRQASYQVVTPPPSAADSGGPRRSSLVSSGAVAEAVNAESDVMTESSTAKPFESTGRLANLPVEMKPLGFVVKADGEFAAILSQDDEIYIIRPGDRFAGRYRALSVSADVVEAQEEPPRQVVPLPFTAAPAFPDFLSTSAQQRSSLVSSIDCLESCKSNGSGEVSAKVPHRPLRGTGILPTRDHGQDADGSGQVDHGTFIFQTLGDVQTQDGEIQAIVADGAQTYLVKQGETFANHYQATSVDPILVLAVKLPYGQDTADLLYSRAESADKSAHLYRDLQLQRSDGTESLPKGGQRQAPDGSGQINPVTSGIADGQTLHQVGASGSPSFADLGVDLFSPASTGFALQSHFFMADNPKVGF